jgi:conjugative relaxase-like TrwC/TraI family protein
MFRPKKMTGRDRGDYFLKLTDYYAGVGGRIEPDGVWFGEGAAALGLAGKVRKRDLRRMLDGYGPNGAPLVQNAGKENGQSGWDCVMAAPKSVSNVWAGRPEYRKQIEAAHDEAVRRTLADAEQLAGWTRRGKAGVDRERARLAVATFQHASSRNGDELLHTHCLFLRPTVRADGTTGALDPRELYRHQQALAGLYRAHLSYLLEQQGFRLKRRKSWFEIEGAPEALVKASSTRREELLEAAAAYGGESGAAREVSRLRTRQEKEMLPRREYFARWQARAEAHGLTAEYAKALVGAVPARDTAGELAAALELGLKRATAEHASFSAAELLRFVAEEAICRGFDPRVLRDAVRDHLANEQKVVKLGRVGDHVRFTTPEMMALEKALLEAAERMAGEGVRPVSSDAIERAIRRTEEREALKARQKDANAGRIELTQEQRAALYHAGQRRLSVIEGLAGTGKTTALFALREAFEREGRKVMGASIAGKAVRGLAEGAGIESYTVARLVGAQELNFVGDFDRTDDEGRRRVKLDRSTVLIVDEAGMLGNRAAERLVREAERTGAAIVLVGDSSQLQAVAAVGGAFKALSARLGSARLTEITRQKEQFEREAVKDFQQGNAAQALRPYVERGLVWVEETREKAIDALVAEWKRSGGLDCPRAHQVFVSTNEERREVNARIQNLLRAEGRLGKAGVEVKDAVVYQGDRVMFLRGSGYLGVENGDMGEVTAVDPFAETVEVLLDRGAKVKVALKKYDRNNLTLSAAITTHKGQGVTVDYSYLLTGGGMTDLHSAYVQGSRARLGAKYFTDAYEAGDDLADLARQMSRRREKELAHDVLEKAGPDRPAVEVKRGAPRQAEHSRDR